MKRVLRHGALLMAALGIVLLGALSAEHLRVDSRIEALLPAQQNRRAEADARAIAERSDLRAPLRVLVAAPTLEASRRGARAVRDQLRTWDESEWAIDERDIGELWSRRALYLSLDQVNALSDTIAARVEWERCEAMPGCISLEERPELPSERELLQDLKVGGLLGAFTAGEGAREGSAPRVLQDRSDGTAAFAMCSEGARESVCAVEARLRISSSDVNAATEVLERVRRMFAQIEGELRAEGIEGLRMEVTGAYRNAPIIRRGAAEDLRRTSMLTLLLLVGLGFFSLRGVRAVLLVFAPLGVALAGTIACVAAWGEALNLIGAFTFAILAGVGVDFGVHLLSRYDELRSHHSAEGAARRAIYELRASMGIAALTTALAFGSLMLTDFPGFRQTGRIAAIGIALSWLSYRMLFVPLARLFDGLVPERRRLVRSLPPARWRIRVRPFLLLCCAIVVGLLGWERTGFETNFRALRPAAAFNQIESRDALGPARGTLVAMSADDPEDLERLGTDAFGEGAWMLSSSLLPRDQEAKLQAFARARAALERVRDESEAHARARSLLVDRPIGVDDLPDWLRPGLVERDGRFGRLALAYVPLSGADAQAMESLNARLDRLREEHPGVRFSAPASALGVVLPQLRADAAWVVLSVLVALLLVVGIAARDRRRIADVFLSLAVAASISWALMVVFGVKLNLYNVLVLPVAFGVGVDGAVYTVWSKGEDARRGILLGTLTTLAAFLSLLFADNPGLGSIGTLACITLSASLFANLVVLPEWMRRSACSDSQPS